MQIHKDRAKRKRAKKVIEKSIKTEKRVKRQSREMKENIFLKVCVNVFFCLLSFAGLNG